MCTKIQKNLFWNIKIRKQLKIQMALNLLHRWQFVQSFSERSFIPLVDLNIFSDENKFVGNWPATTDATEQNEANSWGSSRTDNKEGQKALQFKVQHYKKLRIGGAALLEGWVLNFFVSDLSIFSIKLFDKKISMRKLNVLTSISFFFSTFIDEYRNKLH